MKKTVRAEVNSFVKGFISEASPLNFPDKATIDELNFDLNIDGTRDRRLGFDIEDGGISHTSLGVPTANRETAVYNTYTWDIGDIAGIKRILVVRSGSVLQFYNALATNISTSFISSIDFGSSIPATALSFATVEGSLIVTTNTGGVYVVTYNGGTSFTFVFEEVKVRDVWGVEEKVYPLYENPKYRGAAVTNEHKYNLNNQSWAVQRKNSANVLVRPRDQYFTDLALYPSNAEVVWTGLQFQPVTAGVTFERIYTNLYTELLESGLTAPKGYYILKLGTLGTSRTIEYCATEGIVGVGPVAAVEAEIGQNIWTGGGINCIASYAGRLWYGNWTGSQLGRDSRSPDLTNMVCFSQVVKKVADITKCYQEGDPTSRDGSDLVETDGGFIKIPDMGYTMAMVNVGSSLIIITSNGVWSIQGGSDYGFTATSYKVSRISSFGCTSPNSVIVENDNVYYWGDTGINTITKNQVGDWAVSNITQTSIQTFYSGISDTAKAEVFGTYDKFSKKIKWIYKNNGRFNSNSETWELILDLNLQAYTKNLIPPSVANDLSVVGMFQGLIKRVGSRNDDGIKYVYAQNSGSHSSVLFGEYNNLSYKDWEVASGTGIDAKAYMLTGQQIVGDSSVDKQIPYLTMHFKRTEVGVDPSTLVPLKRSSCLMRCRWDFANTIVSNKWSPVKQMYRYPRAQYVVDSSDLYDNGFEVITTKNKIRGSGRAFSFYMETEPLLDCRILGWNIALTGNTNA